MVKKVLLTAFLASSLGLTGCYGLTAGGGGGGGGMGDEQGVLTDNEPTDDNGVDEFGTHHRPKYHSRRHPAAPTNDHSTGVSGI